MPEREERVSEQARDEDDDGRRGVEAKVILGTSDKGGREDLRAQQVVSAVSKVREGMSGGGESNATHPGEEAAEIEPAPETEADTGECVHDCFRSVTVGARVRKENLIADQRRLSREISTSAREGHSTCGKSGRALIR